MTMESQFFFLQRINWTIHVDRLQIILKHLFFVNAVLKSLARSKLKTEVKVFFQERGHLKKFLPGLFVRYVNRESVRTIIMIHDVW